MAVPEDKPVADALSEPAAPTVSETGSAVVRRDDLRAHPGWGAPEQAEREPVLGSIGRYQVLRALGAGGMGMVYEALDPSLARRVAIKVLRRPDRSAGQQARFAREARALARLQHPNVVAVYDTGESLRGAFVVMQLVDGEPMDRVMARGPMPWRHAVAMVTAAGRGLAAAHAAGIVHRDVKPSNVLIDRDGTVRVGDFGLARSFEEATPEPASTDATAQGLVVDVTQTGAVLGTPLYMAPEQHLGQPATARSDQFSLCVSLYEALYGAHPFAPASRDMTLTLAAMRAEAVRPAPPELRVPRRLERALRRGLRFDPAERFPSMEGLLAALRPPRKAPLFVGVALLATAVATAVVTTAAEPAPRLQLPPRTARDPAIEIRRLTRLGDATRPEISPDGRWLAYVRGKVIYIRDLQRGEDRRIARGLALQWAPGSDRFTFWNLDQEVRQIVSLRGDPPRTVATRTRGWSAGDELITYRASGKEVTFSNERTAATRTCRIPGDYDWLEYVQVSPRFDRALAVTIGDGARMTVWTFALDCSAMRALLVERSLGRVAPRWSADGEAVVIVKEAGDGTSSLVSVPMAWPWMRRVLLTGVDLDAFSIGPDGSIYYDQNDGATHVCRLSKGAPVRLSGEARPRSALAINDDGTAVTYLERRDRGLAFVRHSLVDGTIETRFERAADAAPLHDVALSPDQRQIAIVEGRDGAVVARVIDRAGAPAPTEAGLEVPGVVEATWNRAGLFLNTQNLRDFVVVNGTGVHEGLVLDPSVGWLSRPFLSPDGRSVALYWNRSSYGIWILDLQRRAERLVVETGLTPVGWSRDGAWIYMTDEPEHDRFHRVRVRDGAVRPWLEAPQVGDVREVVATPDGDAIALVRVASSDVFTVPGAAK